MRGILYPNKPPFGPSNCLSHLFNEQDAADVKAFQVAIIAAVLKNGEVDPRYRPALEKFVERGLT